MSVINRPKTALVILRPEYLHISGYDACSAALLNWLEQWHSSKNFKGWVMRTVEEIRDDMLNAFGAKSIREALNRLIKAGFVIRQRHEQYRYNRTYMYQMNVEAVQTAVDAHFAAGSKSVLSSTNVPKGKIEVSDSVTSKVPKGKFEVADSVTSINRTKNRIENRTDNSNAVAPPPVPATGDQAVTLALLIESGVAANIAGSFMDIPRAEIERTIEKSKSARTPAGYVVTALRGRWHKRRGDDHDWSGAVAAMAQRQAAPAQPEKPTNAGDWVPPWEQAQTPKREKAPVVEPVDDELAQVWETAHFQAEMQWRDRFETTLRGAVLLGVSGDTYRIGVRTPSAADLLQRRYYRDVCRIVSDAAGRPVNLQFEVAG